MKFCEYCGSENHLTALRCHACSAPFSIKAVRVKEDVAGRPEEIYYAPQLGEALAPLIPLLVIISLVTYAGNRCSAFARWCRS